MGKLVFSILMLSLSGWLVQAQDYVPEYDLNDDGIIDQEDIFLIQRHWHAAEPTPTPIPIVVNMNEIRTDQSGPIWMSILSSLGHPRAPSMVSRIL